MDEPGTQRLTNEDFRKLLMTPRAPASGAASVRSEEASVHKEKKSTNHEARRKKKNFYAQLKKQEDSILSELSEKYRDRAKERRDGSTPQEQNDARTSTSGYRAVAPDMKAGHGIDAAERRRQLIQESKFLGGDIEHTHLVKGLDYALLQKVRSEIISKEVEQEVELEKMAMQVDEEKPVKEKTEKAEKEKGDKEEPEFKTIAGRNIHRLIQIQKSRQIERNEMFAPNRMAYLIELEDENVDTDIPTTIIRSKAEIPQSESDIQTLSTNDIVINKLAQILSYLRQGRSKKNKKRDKDKPLFKVPEEKPSTSSSKSRNPADDSIYGDIGEYKPSRSSGSGSSSRRDRRDEEKRSRDRDYGSSSKQSSERHKRAPYFDKPSEPLEERPIPAPPKLSSQLINKLTADDDGYYNECYPGLEEMNDAIDDSDDECDYTKMDLGNKKGPIGRWDFDTQEEYSDYMSTKEALPKACFQYGVKMQDGRKTRKHKTEKSEKAELDREWAKIQNIITKRKGDKSSDDVDFKKSKF